MNYSEIIKGHVNEFIGAQNELSSKRLEICQNCPLLKRTSIGIICDPNKYLNPITNEVRTTPKDGFFGGCKCRLKAKTRNPDSKCPAGKW